MSGNSKRRFRFAVSAIPAGTTAAGWRELAVRAEAFGYSTLNVPDHAVGQDISVFSALATAAACTTTLRVAGLVFCNEYRHPLMLAKEVATLDMLSGGRVECGLGVGYGTADFNALGIVADGFATRIERLEESVRILKAAFSGAPVNFSGRYYKVDNVTILPQPARKPHPPIIIGGAGEKIMRAAGRHADIVSINERKSATAALGMPKSPSLAEIRQIVGWLREEAGPRFDDIEIAVAAMAVMVTNDPYGISTGILPDLPALLARARDAIRALVGSREQIVDILQERRETLGVSYWSVPQTAMEAFAPIVARLADT
ncbi:MAG: TIGR03621 family F420-dependent LLM class oxidoreductase [Gammaproteobacteria bacterium]